MHLHSSTPTTVMSYWFDDSNPEMKPRGRRVSVITKQAQQPPTKLPKTTSLHQHKPSSFTAPFATAHNSTPAKKKPSADDGVRRLAKEKDEESDKLHEMAKENSTCLRASWHNKDLLNVKSKTKARVNGEIAGEIGYLNANAKHERTLALQRLYKSEHAGYVAELNRMGLCIAADLQ